MSTSTSIVRLEWNEQQRKWLMYDHETDFFIYDFWDCGSFHRMFPEAQKDKPWIGRATFEKTDA